MHLLKSIRVFLEGTRLNSAHIRYSHKHTQIGIHCVYGIMQFMIIFSSTLTHITICQLQFSYTVCVERLIHICMLACHTNVNIRNANQDNNLISSLFIIKCFHSMTGYFPLNRQTGCASEDKNSFIGLKCLWKFLIF